MTTPTDREAKIAACNKAISDLRAADLDDNWTASREAQDRLVALINCPPAPDGKELRALRADLTDSLRVVYDLRNKFLSGGIYEKNTDAAYRLREEETRISVLLGVCAKIDRLTSAPVADAEVAPPVREGALQGTPTRMTDADRREVDALKKRAFDEASAIVEPTPAEWCDQIMDVVARSRTRTGLSEPIRLDMDEIVCDRSELERAAKWLRTALADMLAVAQQVGIVYVADHHAPVAGPTPAILRAIAKMQRDAGDADQLRSAGLSLRAENARLQTDLAAAEQRQQNAEGIAAQQSVRAERAEGEAMVLRADLAAAREELRTLTVDRDIKVMNLTTQLAAARADQAAMARRELEWLLQAMSRWHQAVTDLTPSAGNRRGAIEDVVGTLRLRLAALPQPKPAAEAFRDAAKNCTGEMFGEQAAVKPAAEPQQALTAAIPPLPIDEGRVRDDLADFRDWMIDNMRFVECLRIGSELHPLGGAIQVTDYYIAEINKRLSALAGKEKP